MGIKVFGLLYVKLTNLYRLIFKVSIIVHQMAHTTAFKFKYKRTERLIIYNLTVRYKIILLYIRA
jgi:hypothetical protein